MVLDVPPPAVAKALDHVDELERDHHPGRRRALIGSRRARWQPDGTHQLAPPTRTHQNGQRDEQCVVSVEVERQQLRGLGEFPHR
jgi:hypothetical protein